MDVLVSQDKLAQCRGAVENLPGWTMEALGRDGYALAKFRRKTRDSEQGDR
ncbi:MAG: hypothetical protein PHV85_03415 [Desulfovibrionaceae bacterium]|nr:hypothetical protein [Desulfovibrionaceae bacterium]